MQKVYIFRRLGFVVWLIFLAAGWACSPSKTAETVPKVEQEATQEIAAVDTPELVDTPQQEKPPPAEIPTVSVMDVVLEDARHIMGNADAPVTIVEYSDFK